MRKNENENENPIRIHNYYQSINKLQLSYLSLSLPNKLYLLFIYEPKVFFLSKKKNWLWKNNAMIHEKMMMLMMMMINKKINSIQSIQTLHKEKKRKKSECKKNKGPLKIKYSHRHHHHHHRHLHHRHQIFSDQRFTHTKKTEKKIRPAYPLFSITSNHQPRKNSNRIGFPDVTKHTIHRHYT